MDGRTGQRGEAHAPGPLWAFLRDERASTALEYGLICCMIFLATAGAIATMAHIVQTDFWDKLAAAMIAASG